MTNVYEQPRYEGARALAEAIDADDDELLASMIVAAALYEDDFAVVHRACVHLSKHADDQVRGNAVLGFGHIARAFGRLGDDAIAILRNRLHDPSAYVRGQAHAAVGDVRQFVGELSGLGQPLPVAAEP